MNPANRVYRHIVLFEFKPTATAQEIQTVVGAFAALPAQLPSVLEFEHGVNESPENLNDGFTHVFVLTFATREAFETAYLHEPAHQAFVGTLSGVLARALVVDFIPNRD